MARIRMIKPEFFDDTDVADISLAARLCFIGLWTQADRAGLLGDDPRRLKARLFPYDDVNIDALMSELAAKNMISRYTADDGKAYVWITKFLKHQRPHPKELASVIPPPKHPAVEKNGEPCKKTARTSESGVLILDSGIRNLESGGRPAQRRRDGVQVDGWSCEHFPQCPTRHACIEKALEHARVIG